MSPVADHWNAEDYAGNSSAQHEWALELFDKLSVQGDERILDIGCGDGKVTARMAQRLPRGRVCGIDLSPDMIRLAAERYSPETHSNLSFRQMDATDIRFSDVFDIAFSNATLHWVQDHLSILRGVHACLQPGGKILFQMGGRGNAVEILDAIRDITKRAAWENYFQAFTPPYHFYGPEEYNRWRPAFPARGLSWSRRTCSIREWKGSKAGSGQHGFPTRTACRPNCAMCFWMKCCRALLRCTRSMPGGIRTSK